MGKMFSSGKSAAKRQAKAMEAQMEQDRLQFEAEQARLAQEREAADIKHQEMIQKQEAQSNAAKLQAQIAEDNRTRGEDEVADVTTDFDTESSSTKRKRKPMELSQILGI